MANYKVIARSGVWVLPVGCAVAATLCYAGYMAHGMVVGDLIGLPGREGGIAAAQIQAQRWLVFSAWWQGGVVMSLIAALSVGADLPPFRRYCLRTLTAALLSFPFTLIIGTLLIGALRLFASHHI